VDSLILLQYGCLYGSSPFVPEFVGDAVVAWQAMETVLDVLRVQEWLANRDFGQQANHIIAEARQGVFPQPPEAV
jgi:hypothetical protein